MNPTSVSLLDRLKVARPDASDWNRLQGIYLPLIRRWLGRVPGLGDEAADLAQEVLVVVFREIPRFDRQREGSFRAWLRQVTVNQVRNYRRQRQRRPAVGPRPGRRVPRTPGRPERRPGPRVGPGPRPARRRRSCWRSSSPTSPRPPGRRSGGSASRASRPARVAEELGLTENAVILAKSRVLKRLREEAGELLG